MNAIWQLVRSFFSGPPEPELRGRSLAWRGALWARLALRVNLVMGFFAIVVFASTRRQEVGFFRVLGLGLLLAGASYLVGATLGFLFGIPRRLQAAPAAPAPRPAPQGETVEEEGAAEPVRSPSGYESNTSLEQISDWLTKIIVGLTLTQWAELRRGVQQLVEYAAPAFGGGSEVFVGSTITLAAICGFFSGYLPTRLFLWLALTESDIEGSNLPRLYQERKTQTVKEVEAVQAAAPRPAVAGGEGSSAEKGDAIRARQEIQELAARYESLRATLPPGPKRTAKMEEVLHQMRQLAPQLDSELLATLEQSNAPGEKLAFIAWLQVYPRAEKLRWLADCLGSEKPFIGYHAAVALHTAAVSAQIDARSVLEAIRRAQSLLEPTEFGTDRARMLRDAEREAKARL